MDIATNIKVRRMELGLSQQDLADAIGYRSRSAVAKIESGASELPVSKLLGLSEALDMPVEEILGSSYRGPDAPATRRRSRSGARTAAVVLAGGRSTRNLKNIPNQFTNVLGRPVISYCLETYQNHPLVDDIYVVCPPEWKNVVNAYARRFGIAKLADVVSPGSTGAASAKIGLERILRDGYRESDFVIFQESTRPLVSEEFISRLLRDCMERGTAIACEKAGERMQFLRRDDGSVEYVDRDSLVDLQSPDAHSIELIKAVFYKAEQTFHPLTESNCGMLMYNLGFDLNFCECDRRNLKVVRQEDIAILAAILRSNANLD